MYVSNIHTISVLLCLALAAGDCSTLSLSSQQETASLNRRQLLRNMFDAGKLLWVYSTEDSAAAHFYSDFASKVQSEISNNTFTVIAKADTALTEKDLKEYPVFLLGKIDNSLLDKYFSSQLPYRYQDDTLHTPIGGYSLLNDDLWVINSFPNPYNQQLPLHMILGQQDQPVIDYLQNSDPGRWGWLFYSQWGYELVKDQKRVVMGYFDAKDNGQWDFDSLQHWDFTHQPVEECIASHYTVIRHGEIDEAMLSRVLDKVERSCRQLTDWLNKPLPEKQIPFHVYPSAEKKGLQMRNTDQMHADFESHALYAVVHEAFVYDDIIPANRLVLQNYLGQPALWSLEVGLAAWYSEPWQEGGFQTWGSRLREANALLPLKVLCDNNTFNQASRLIRQCQSALWVDFLIQKWGKAVFLNRYPTWEPTDTELYVLEKAWETYLEKLPLISTPDKRDQIEMNTVFLKGFNFAHEGYSIYNGYISQEAEQSIEAICGMGGNTVAIIPYTGTRSTRTPTPLGFSERAGSENDESVILSMHYAQKRGMHVLLKPQIWVSGAWPGDIQMQSQADWNQFFAHYRAWIMHYALMGELYGVDVFCIGVELVASTLEQPDQWRKLIQDIRKVYTGEITYAANWGKEFEQLTFWDELDYIGIDCYYPLSDKLQMNKAELQRSFAQVADNIAAKAQQYDKQVIITEIGFRSIEAPWQQPHDYPNGKAANPAHQALCYEIVAETLHGSSWLKGLLWWKWPSYMGYADNNATGFTPAGKPAAHVVEKWFRQMK